MEKFCKITFLIFLLTSIAGSLSARKIGALKGIYKPAMIKVFGDEIFAVEGHRIFIYSLKDLSLKKIMGKQGDGPGEYKLDPSRPLIISITEDHIIAESRFKVVYFSRRGEYVRQDKKSYYTTLQTLPFGDNRLIYKYVTTDPKKNRTYFTLGIWDKKGTLVKELHRQKFFSFEDKSFIMPDSIHYSIYKNRVYVEKSNEGLVIAVYDSRGNLIRRIEKPYTRLKVSDQDKREAYQGYINIPSLRRFKKERGEAALKSFLSQVKFIYPQYHLPVKDIAVSGDKIYLRTCKIINRQEEYLVMDLNGNLLKKILLPVPRKVDFIVQLQGDKKYYNIHDNKFYYLKLVTLTGEDEDWELHVENLD